MITVFEYTNCKILSILIFIVYHLLILVFVFNVCFGQFFFKGYIRYKTILCHKAALDV